MMRFLPFVGLTFLVACSGSSSQGTSGSCSGYAQPSTAAGCTCTATDTSKCQPNGCYNGYWCDTGANKCVPMPKGCGSTTGGTGGTSGTSGSGFHRVLFDAAHAQVAGNACWIVDASMPDPAPANPGSEGDWSGGISAWGFDLFHSGRYAIHQLPSGTELNYGQGGAGDLSQVDVFISDEPGQPFTDGEQAALMQFARAGGGIFLVSDHSGAKRCSTCSEAWQVINQFLHGSAAQNAFGVQCDGNNVGGSGLLGNVTSSAPASLGNGPFGTGTQLAYHSGSTVSVDGSNAQAQVAINSSAGGMMAMSQLSGGGRLVLVGDSSPADDGTSTCNATLYDGWSEASDRALLLNATAWVAHDGS